MALNVFGSSQQYLGVVVELPETQIAGVAQQSADLARDVVVVDRPRAAASPGLVGAANGAAVLLSLMVMGDE